MTRTLEQRAVIQQADEIKRAERKALKKAHRAKMDPVKRDRGRVRDTKHLQFIRRLPCVAILVRTGNLVAPCDAAHIRAGSIPHGKPYTGKQVKPSDCWTLPLSRAAHEEQHGGAELYFWEQLGVNPFDLAQMIYNCSGDYDAALAIIQGLGK